MKRFISVIEYPGRVWTDHCVIDTVRQIVMCKCADGRQADEIAGCLNVQYRERAAKQIPEEAGGFDYDR